MSIPGRLNLSGHYDDNGQWQRTKFCFVYCGERCDCGPPNRQHYSAAHDKRPPSQSGTDAAPVSVADILLPQTRDDARGSNSDACDTASGDSE